MMLFGYFLGGGGVCGVRQAFFFSQRLPTTVGASQTYKR